MKLKTLNNFEAAIFDFDGTLVDSLSLWRDVDVAFFKEFNMEVPENYDKEIAHLNFNEIADFTIKKYKLNTTSEYLLKFWHDFSIEEYSHNIKCKPFAKGFLKYLKDNNIKISLATTNKEELFMPCLLNNGIDSYFDYKLNVNDYNTSKKEPKIYLEACKLMNTTPDKTIVFEDILEPILTAKKANFQVVGVYDKHNLSHLKDIQNSCDLFINSYDELLNK